MILVCDNLNTHTIGAFYEAFEPATAWSDPAGIPPHAQAWQLAEHCGERVSGVTRQCSRPPLRRADQRQRKRGLATRPTTSNAASTGNFASTTHGEN